MPSTAQRVLVVDDEPEFRQLVAGCLAEEGFEVLEAGDGLEALLQLKRERPDILLLDLRMPRLGGLEVLRRVQALAQPVRVLIVTGFPEDVPQGALPPGVDAVFVKPFEMTALLRALRADAAPGAAAPGAPAATRPGGAAPRRPARVLVVDDDPDVGSTLLDILGELGHAGRWVADGSSALRALMQAPPDVVLLDILMPGLSGLDALPSIRALAPGVPVIMVSGAADEQLGRRALARGAFYYVVKPVDFRYLADAIELALLLRPSAD